MRKMKINKIYMNLLLLVGLFLFFSSFVSATVTIETPAASGTVSGAIYHWNASMSGSFHDVLNCSIWAISSSTANSTYAEYLNLSQNDSGALANTNQSFYNGTFNSNVLEDSNDYTFLVACYNSTNSNENSSTVTATVGNTEPTAATSLSPTDASTDTDGSVTFSGSVNDSETTGCTLYFDGKNPGASSYAMTYSTTSCTHTLSSVPEQSYKWYITASDGTDTTDSTTSTITVDKKTSSGKAALLASQQGIKSEGGALLSIASGSIAGIPTGVILVLIALVVIFVIVRRK